MKVKKIIGLFFLMIGISCIYSQGGQEKYVPLVFSYELYAADRDVFSGNSPNLPGSHRNFRSKENISSCKVIRTTYDHGSYAPGSEVIEEYMFKNGLLIEHIYSFSGSNSVTTYLYDDSNRLLQSGEYYSYEYPEGKSSRINERVKFYKGDIRSYQKIETNSEGFKYFEDNPTSIYGLQTFTYIYQNSVLQEISKMYEQRMSTTTTKFYYEDSLLKKITTHYEGEETPREIYLITNYDENNNMLELKSSTKSRSGLYVTNEYFSDYDSHGNWQKLEIYHDEKLIDVYEREFVYIK